ncbi:MAG: di-heme oxidoredictase family protein [Betaproteobacteria bacterium]
MLLHDMGDDLADGRPDFEAGPRDWRTPALWGLGLSQTVSGSTAMLHFGRARNVTEAILWHGGEAERSREAFHAMTGAERDALVKFVESI